MKKLVVTAPDLASQIKQFAEMKNEGALSAEQFEQSVAKLLADTSDSGGRQSRRDILLFWIQLLVTALSAIVFAFAGWTGSRVFVLNREVGTLEQRLQSVESDVENVKLSSPVGEGQTQARQEAQSAVQNEEPLP